MKRANNMYISHSYYSLRYGVLSIEELIGTAKSMDINTLVLADINNSTGIPYFVKDCEKAGIKPVAGIEFRHKNKYLYTGIARNNEGLGELNEFLSHHNINKTPLPFPPSEFNDAYTVYPIDNHPERELKENERINIKPPEVNRLLSMKKRFDVHKLVGFQTVSFRDKEGWDIHRNLRAIDNNTLIDHLKPEQLAGKSEYFIDAGKLKDIYVQYPEIMENSARLLDDCAISFDDNALRNKQVFSASRYDDRLLLEKLAWDGMQYRYGNDNAVARERIKHELDIIDKLGFAAYFLITWDIIRYSMARGFYHVGRGSGANSIIAYCLKITNVDPIDLNLYFERFINPRRSTPPDFDIDYSWKERDDVLDYIFKRYGCHHTALLGTMSTFRGKSIIRELGKIYGLPKEEIDSLINNPGDENNHNSLTDKILYFGSKIADFPNMRSIHAGGVLISERPITCYTALDMPPKGFPTTQWDMYVAEELGFEKIDILSQRGIGHIKESADIIRKNRGVDVDVHAIQKFKNDSKVKEYLARGETKGCFYIESPAMRGLLQKLKCSDYPTLVAASSVIRPGVARSGMMKQYIQRFHNPGGFKYLHPVMKEQLSETYGVMVYQEDVLKICHHFAGLDLSDADTLRRGMSGKYRSKEEIRKITTRFFENCRRKGYPEEITKEVWRQIESFAGYSFSKAHSASYAVESMQSLYLKAHFPLEFIVAVINNFGGFYRTWVYAHEALRYNAVLHPPCVNNSRYKTNIKGNNIYLGFIHIQNLDSSVATIIEKVRSQDGNFRDLNDFLERVRPGLEQAILLIRVGAFRFTGKSKAELLWMAHLILNNKKTEKSHSLFESPAKEYRLPKLENHKIEDAYDEIELLGFPVSISWFGLLKTSFRGDITASDMGRMTGSTVRMVGHLITVKYIKTVNRQWMNFGCFIDHKGQFFDTVHFSDSLEKYPFRGSGTYLLLGKIVEDFGFHQMEVEKMAKLPVKQDPRY
ncbi:MAG: DNA polymerase III subunit alpha [Bacteroidota bacterium]|nr:DNA polymerase III subunit alpha [Bacteroidota bacterium]